jgi:hypothetical protein
LESGRGPVPSLAGASRRHSRRAHGSGAHKLVTSAFPQWVSTEVTNAAKKLSLAEARTQCADWLTSAV